MKFNPVKIIITALLALFLVMGSIVAFGNAPEPDNTATAKHYKSAIEAVLSDKNLASAQLVVRLGRSVDAVSDDLVASGYILSDEGANHLFFEIDDSKQPDIDVYFENGIVVGFVLGTIKQTNIVSALAEDSIKNKASQTYVLGNQLLVVLPLNADTYDAVIFIRIDSENPAACVGHVSAAAIPDFLNGKIFHKADKPQTST